jgi:type VI secretion system protein
MMGSLPGRAAAGGRYVGEPVRTHLTLLLNTRQGAVPNLPDYGLPDVSSFYSDYPNSIGELRAHLERLIRKYEPRLLGARVKRLSADDKDFRVAFLISGEIEDDGRAARVQYRTTISANGRAALESDDDLEGRRDE